MRVVTPLFLFLAALPGEETIERLIDLGRVAEARTRLRSLPGEPDRALVLEAMILYREGRPAESLRLLQPLTAKPTAPSDAHKLAALSLVALGRQAEAGSYIVEAVRLAPNDFMARYYLGLHQLDKRQPEQAAITFAAAVPLNPDYPDVYTMLGLAQEQSGRDTEALASYRKGVELTERLRIKKDSAYVYAGRYLNSRNENDEAIRYLEAAVNVSPRSPEAWLLLGKTRSALGRNGGALQALHRAAELAPRDKRVRFQLMQTYQRMGRMDEARREREMYESMSGAELGRWEEKVIGNRSGKESKE